MEPLSIFLLLVYASLVIEMTVFPIPSEASVYQIFTTEDEETPGGKLAAARGRSALLKFLFYFVPTATGVVLFLIPLTAAFVPRIIDYLVPIDALARREVFWCGVALVLLGRAITFSSVLWLRAARRAEREPAGIFRFSRNPGLVGMFTLYLGLALIFPCVVLLVGFFPYVLNMHQRVLMEESHLRRRLGPSYADYLKRVPRYLVF